MLVDVAPHLVRLPSGGAGVASSGVAAQSSAVLTALAPRLATAMRSWSGVAIVDCGRLGRDSPALPLIAAADRLVVLVEPTVAGVVHVRDERDRLLSLGPIVDLMISGEGPYRAEEVEAFTELGVRATIPRDHRGAMGVMGALSPRAARRTPLGRAARSFVDALRPDDASEHGIQEHESALG
jgi:hypothetical protein